jgi:NO-binding membrane sensor protein with MHYT domain
MGQRMANGVVSRISIFFLHFTSMVAAGFMVQTLVCLQA